MPDDLMNERKKGVNIDRTNGTPEGLVPDVADWPSLDTSPWDTVDLPTSLPNLPRLLPRRACGGPGTPSPLLTSHPRGACMADTRREHAQ